MNIALFPSAFYPSLGGVEELTRLLAHQLARDGNSVLVATNRWPKSLPARENFEGIDLRRYKFRVPGESWRQRMGAKLLGHFAADRLGHDLNSFCAHVVHVQCVSSNSVYARQAAKHLRLPLVVTLQGELTMDAGGLFQRSDRARAMLTAALDEADCITACSRHTLAEAEAFYGRPFGDRGRVIYNGVRLQDFDDITPYVHPRPYILAIGRHVRQKGFDVLLRSFALLTSRRQTDHDLVLAGDGTERTQLEELANCLGVSKRVHFIGRVDRVAAAGLFCGCSYFVLPSRHEPLGIVNIEAMAAGKAVIATRVGGVPEIVQDGITGLLVDSDSIEPMADAMLKLCRDAGLRQRLGSCGAAQVSRFDWEVIAAEYLTVYHQVYSRAKTGARTLPGANHE